MRKFKKRGSMATYAVIDVIDSERRVSPLRMRVTDAAMPTGYQSFIAGVIAATFGAAAPSLGGVARAYVEIDATAVAQAPISDTDVRFNWQTRWTSAYPRPFRLGIPARNPLAALIATGSVVLGDLTASDWAAWISAVNTGAVTLKDPTNGDAATGILAAVAGVRGRKRPRIGSTR
jgi:hypothetical protein